VQVLVNQPYKIHITASFTLNHIKDCNKKILKKFKKYYISD